MLVLSSCFRGGNTAGKVLDAQDSIITAAKLLSMQRTPHYTLVTVGDPWKGGVLHRYVLVPRESELPKDLPEGTIVRTPISNALVYSSVHTSLLDELGAQKIIARATTASQEKFLLRNGAEAVVFPERQLGSWTAIRYSVNNVLNYIELPGANSIFEVGVPAYWAGMTIGELDLAGKYHVNIMATKKDDQLDMKIGPDTKLEGGESILVYGKDRDLQRGLNLGNKRFHSD